MPDSDYTRTPPTATEMQVTAMSDKINDICKHVEKLSELPQKIDRMSLQFEQLSKDHEKTQNDLQQTKSALQDDLDRAKKSVRDEIKQIKDDANTRYKSIEDDIDKRDEKLEKTLNPLVESKTKIDTIGRIVYAGGGVIILALIGAWTNLGSKMELTSAQSANNAQRLQVVEKNQDEGRAARQDLQNKVSALQLDVYRRGVINEK